MKKSKRGICMADGGITQETPDQLMAMMTAKYGAPSSGTAQQQPEVVAKPVVQPQPAPQPTGSGQGILGILRGRKDVIDKASGYANGGIVRGKGTPTSDDVPVTVHGKQYNFSDTEAVLPSRTRQALGEMLGAKAGDVADANKRVEAFIEQTNGKPPVSVEAGSNLAAGGLLDEEARRMNYQDVTGIAAPAPTPAPTPAAADGGISLGRSPAPTIYGNGGLPADVVQRGIDTMRSQLAKPQMPAMATPGSPVSAPSATTVDDGHGGVYTPGGGAIAPDKAGSGILAGAANFFKDSAEAARSGVHYDQVRANRLAGEASTATPAPQPASSATANPSDFKPQDPFGPKPEAMGVGKSADGQFATGKTQYDQSGLNKTGMATPDSSGSGFTAKDGTSYNVNPSKQEGIAKITATSKNPLYTNIKPEDAVAGLKNQMIGGSAADVQEGLDRHARANAVWQSVIDKQPQGGIAILGDGGIAADNAEKTARWRQDDLLAQAKGGNRAAGEVARETARGQNQIAAEAIRGGTQLASEQGRNAVAMRGQDINAQSDANRIAGNPLDNQIKQNQVAAGAMTNANAKQLQDLHAAYGSETDPAKQRAIAEQIRALSGKGGADRFLVVPGGEEIGPDGMTKIRRPSSVFDTGTRQPISMDQGQQGGASGADKIKADMQAGKISRDEAIKQLKAMGYR